MGTTDRRWRGTATLAVVTVSALTVVGLTSSTDPDGDAPLVRAADVGPADNALRGEVSLLTTAATMVTLRVASEDGHGFTVATDEPDREHRIPLLGLRADRVYEVTAEVTGPAGRIDEVAVGRLRTGALPDDLPPVAVSVRDRAAMAPGLTMFDSIYRPPADGVGPRDRGWLVAVDTDGEVVWYHREQQPIQDARRLDDGTLLFVSDEIGVRRVTPTGELVGEWIGRTAAEVVTEDAEGRPVATDDALVVDTDQLHHEVDLLPNGNLITLGREVREVTYPEPMCEDSPDSGTERVVGDTVLEFEPTSGRVVREYALFDVLDPLENVARTKQHEFCNEGYFANRYPDVWPVRDWTHANAVVLDEARNALLVSLRHTDEVVALRYEDDVTGPGGQLLWRLGESGDIRLEDGGTWFLHQHAPEVQADGSVVLYDNGNERPGTDLEDDARLPYSRAVRYEIDDAARTARQVWEHRFPTADGVYAPYVGDADVLGATILITHGGLLDPLGHEPGAPGHLAWGRLIEVEVATGRVVFDLTTRDPAGEEGWGIYRAERIPTIYPSGYTVASL